MHRRLVEREERRGECRVAVIRRRFRRRRKHIYVFVFVKSLSFFRRRKYAKIWVTCATQIYNRTAKVKDGE